MAKNLSREEEPSIAPNPDRWYNLSLGPSFRDHNPSSKFCTLRYEFKPASVDKSRAGSLHKTKDNKVTVEFQNNQHGKPKVIFEGVTEDYKDNDAVLFFDGESFCLEQLHRAVKRLRHVRDLGEASASSSVPNTISVGATAESYPPVCKAPNDQFSDKEPPKAEVDDVNVESDDPESVMNQLYGVKTEQENLMDSPPAEGNTSTEIADATKYESDENIDIIDDHGGYEVAKEEDEEENHSRAEGHRGIEIDINIPHQDDEEEDFEIADVDVSDGEVNNTGFNAAEALRAQVAGEREKGSSSSCSSSSRSSSGSSSSSSSSSSGSSSDSGSASSGSASSHDESVTSI